MAPPPSSPPLLLRTKTLSLFCCRSCSPRGSAPPHVSPIVSLQRWLIDRDAKERRSPLRPFCCFSRAPFRAVAPSRYADLTRLTCVLTLFCFCFVFFMFVMFVLFRLPYADMSLVFRHAALWSRLLLFFYYCQTPPERRVIINFPRL